MGYELNIVLTMLLFMIIFIVVMIRGLAKDGLITAYRPYSKKWFEMRRKEGK